MGVWGSSWVQMTQSIAKNNKNELKTPSIVKKANKAKVALETPLVCWRHKTDVYKT